MVMSVIFHCCALFFFDVLFRAHPVLLVQKHTQLSVKCYEALCESECWRPHFAKHDMLSLVCGFKRGNSLRASMQDQNQLLMCF